jgi:glycerophosphoryl diester phosphodiesterase
MARTLVIGHRGAPGHLPEHTLEGYRLAVRLGADVIEPDLVSTRDGVLVARHENELSGTTDVALRFPERKTTKVVDGVSVTGWFVEDLTLAEVRTLRARQPMEGRSVQFDGTHPVPTFDEILALLPELRQTAGRAVGIEPETKHPAYFRALGLALEPPMLASLARHGLDDGRPDVFVQSFEEANLRALRGTTRTRLLRLVDGSDAALLTAAGLQEISTYADGVGAAKKLLIDEEGRDTGAVARIHAAGLQVHVWTFRNEARYLPAWCGGDPAAELRRHYALGVDAVFADYPDTAAAARP